jgi:hypothetical protein
MDKQGLSELFGMRYFSVMPDQSVKRGLLYESGSIADAYCDRGSSQHAQCEWPLTEGLHAFSNSH